MQNRPRRFEAKRKIEAEEEPYVDESDPEGSDGTPPFLEEWQHADECVASLGRWSVLLLSSCLKGYLEEFARDMNSWYGIARLESKETTKGKEGLARFVSSFFLCDYGIDWAKVPPLIEDLEHLVLTRNDLEHNSNIVSGCVYQTPFHREKRSSSIFTGDQTQFWRDEAQLIVDSSRLARAVESVKTFCSWLDGIRTNYREFLKER